MASKSNNIVSRSDFMSAPDDEKETLLEHDSEPDEDVLFNRSSSSTENDRQSNKKIDHVKVQIQEVTDVMYSNVQKILERGETLEELQEASERLNIVGHEFRDAARKVQRRAWMQNMRTRIIVVGITIVAILCIIVLDIMVFYLVVK